MEFIGTPESARLFNHSPSFWVNKLGQECAMAAAVNLQREEGFMMSNLQILAQFVTSLNRMSSEMLSERGSRSLSCGGGGEAICDAEGAAGSQVHDSDGPVASSVGSGCSRAIAGDNLPFLHEA